MAWPRGLITWVGQVRWSRGLVPRLTCYQRNNECATGSDDRDIMNSRKEDSKSVVNCPIFEQNFCEKCTVEGV